MYLMSMDLILNSLLMYTMQIRTEVNFPGNFHAYYLGHDYIGTATTTLREWTFVPESGDFSMAIRPSRDSSSR
jgi:hypothetical protein